jgi:transposase
MVAVGWAAGPDEGWCIVLVVVERDGSLVLVVEATRSAVACPQCGEVSRRQHSRYERCPLDLPWRGKTVRMRVHTRRWFCDTPSCARRIFAERFDGALARYARRTDGATDLLTTFALQAGGEGGARLARKAGVPISPDTLLRILHALTDATDERGPRVLGVDDVALRRKQRRYGTLLIDLENHRPIDLLDDRTADVFANWLRCHPGVEVIVRDRAGAYAEGGKQGAPDAIQVADRFHLSANASAAMDEVLRSRRRHIEYVVVADPATEQGPTPTAPVPPPSGIQQELARRHSRRRARWDEVRARRAASYSIQRIAREMGMHRRTVRRYLAAPEVPRNRPPERPRPKGLTSPTLQPFVEYLQGRWQAGCTNVAQLKRELDAQGYRGSYSLMMQSLSPWRAPRPPPEPGRAQRRGRPRAKRVNVRWLCLRPPNQLEPHERDALEDVLADDDRLAVGYDLLQRFRRLVSRRSVRDLDDWLVDAADSGLRPFASLAHGIWTDFDAVVNGLKLAWSTGPVEGTVTRLKLLKRQGYGRASTRVLRRRLISAA